MSLLSQHLLPTCQPFFSPTAVRTIGLFNSNQADGSIPVAEIGKVTSIINATIENQTLRLNNGALIIEPEYSGKPQENFTFEIIFKGTTLPFFEFSPINNATQLASNSYNMKLYASLHGGQGWENSKAVIFPFQPHTHIVISRKNSAWAFWQDGILLTAFPPTDESFTYLGSPLPINLGLYTYSNYYSHAEILGCRVMQGNPYSHDANISPSSWPLKPIFID